MSEVNGEHDKRRHPPPISGLFMSLEHTDTRMRIHTEQRARLGYLLKALKVVVGWLLREPWTGQTSADPVGTLSLSFHICRGGGSSASNTRRLLQNCNPESCLEDRNF